MVQDQMSFSGKKVVKLFSYFRRMHRFGPSVRPSHLTFFGVYGQFLGYCTCLTVWLVNFITAPAHPHTTRVAVYPTLFYITDHFVDDRSVVRHYLGFSVKLPSLIFMILIGYVTKNRSKSAYFYVALMLHSKPL